MSHSTHTWVIDVMEEDSASIEVDGRLITPIPRWVLPAGVKEGDVLSVEHERETGRSVLMITVDHAQHRQAMQRSAKQMSKRSKHDAGGDITL